MYIKDYIKKEKLIFNKRLTSLFCVIQKGGTMSNSKRNYRIKTFEKLEALGISSEKEILNMKVNQLKLLIPFSVKDILNIIEMQEGVKKDGLIPYLFGTKKEK